MEQKPPVSRAQFVATLGVCLLVLIAASVAVQRLTAHTVSRRLLAETREASNTRVIALGNSLMRSGFVPDAFAESARSKSESPAFNLAMGASTPPEQLLLLRAGLRAMPDTQLLLYGFYDFQLTDPVAFSSADLIGNHDILYYDEPEFARRFYQMSRYDAAAFEIDRRLPMLAERGAVWGKVELLRRAISQLGMPAEARNQFGRAADFTLLEAKNRDEFEQHCAAATQAMLNAPVAEIIREAQEKGIRVVFIAMPLPPRHVELFYDTPAWASYQQHIRQLLAASRVTYLDASRWMADAAKFDDALHLSPAGAKEFSRRLGAACSDLKNLRACGAH